MDNSAVADEQRRALFTSKFTVCPPCKSTKIHQRNIVNGFKTSSDVYGYTVFRCLECGWRTQFQFDDSADVYYYETKGWNREGSK
jgi:RNase P subunit RPR2